MDRAQLTLLGTGSCVVLTVLFTVKLLFQHVSHWKNPKEQTAIMIIIFMAPLYAIVSFVGLLDFMGSKSFFTTLESIKECYEALVSSLFLLNHETIQISKMWHSFVLLLIIKVFPLIYGMQVIAKFLALMYSYLKISISKNIVPDEVKGREIHHSFPMTLFQVRNEFSFCFLIFSLLGITK